MAGEDAPQADRRPIEPSVPLAVQQELLAKLLATRKRDLEAVELAHRNLLSAGPGLHRRLLRWLAQHEPDSPHLAVGLALLSLGPDPEARRFAARLVEALPLGTVADLVDYIHGWRVDRRHVKLARRRFQDEMSAAYRATAGIVREELEKSPGGKDSEFRGGEILITLGAYDRVQQVLDHLQLPYRTLPCQVLETVPLRADQVVIVNCPGQFSSGGVETIRRFVAAGGTLVTTDWALHTTVERAFPGTIEYNQRPTADDVVAVSWIHPDSPMTRGVDVPGQTLRWWLEGSSYPIRVLDRRVAVLVRSTEMGRKYGEDALVVTFDYGEGTVIHLTSHYYLQRSQGDKSAKAGDAAATEALGAKLREAAGAEQLGAERLSAAYSSMRLLGNILYESRRKCGV
jgi:hypothetical protein